MLIACKTSRMLVIGDPDWTLYMQISRSRECCPRRCYSTKDRLNYEIRGNTTESIRIHVYRHDILLEHKVTLTPHRVYGLANKCTSHAELEDILYGYAIPKPALNVKQVCKIAYFYFIDRSLYCK